MLNERRDKIEESITLAEQNKAQAKAIEETRQQTLRKTKEQAQEIIEEAKTIAEQAASEIRAKAEVEAERSKTQAASAIAAKKQAITAEVEDDLTELVTMAVEQVLKQKNITVTADEVAKVVAEIRDTK
jgi:F-type H+-transporting ATPase subunit b